MDASADGGRQQLQQKSQMAGPNTSPQGGELGGASPVFVLLREVLPQGVSDSQIETFCSELLKNGAGQLPFPGAPAMVKEHYNALLEQFLRDPAAKSIDVNAGGGLMQPSTHSVANLTTWSLGANKSAAVKISGDNGIRLLSDSRVMTNEELLSYDCAAETECDPNTFSYVGADGNYVSTYVLSSLFAAGMLDPFDPVTSVNSSFVVDFLSRRGIPSVDLVSINSQEGNKTDIKGLYVKSEDQFKKPLVARIFRERLQNTGILIFNVEGQDALKFLSEVPGIEIYRLDTDVDGKSLTIGKSFGVFVVVLSSGRLVLVNIIHSTGSNLTGPLAGIKRDEVLAHMFAVAQNTRVFQGLEPYGQLADFPLVKVLLGKDQNLLEKVAAAGKEGFVNFLLKQTKDYVNSKAQAVASTEGREVRSEELDQRQTRQEHFDNGTGGGVGGGHGNQWAS